MKRAYSFFDPTYSISKLGIVPVLGKDDSLSSQGCIPNQFIIQLSTSVIADYAPGFLIQQPFVTMSSLRSAASSAC